ncbi:hypothetical protein ACQFX9_07705 [Aliinostoc sp. HNIBRCY26]|nr:hypothetical protein [Nostoc sp. CENA543]
MTYGTFVSIVTSENKMRDFPGLRISPGKQTQQHELKGNTTT